MSTIKEGIITKLADTEKNFNVKIIFAIESGSRNWDLEKFLKHMVKSYATLLEWLKSNVVYIKNEYCTNILKYLGDEFFNSIAVSYHYLSIAKKEI